jgi:hypothetical protein
MSDLIGIPKKIKLSIPKAQPSAEQRDTSSQHGPRVNSIKIVKKEEIDSASFIKKEPSNSLSSEENSKRRRKSKVKMDEDYEYEPVDMAYTEAFGAEEYALDPDELQDFDDDYDVLGKPRRMKAKKQASSNAQVNDGQRYEGKTCFWHIYKVVNTDPLLP